MRLIWYKIICVKGDITILFLQQSSFQMTANKKFQMKAGEIRSGVLN